MFTERITNQLTRKRKEKKDRRCSGFGYVLVKTRNREDKDARRPKLLSLGETGSDSRERKRR